MLLELRFLTSLLVHLALTITGVLINVYKPASPAGNLGISYSRQDPSPQGKSHPYHKDAEIPLIL